MIVAKKILAVFVANVCLAPKFLEVKFKFPGLFGGLKLSDKNVFPRPPTLSRAVPPSIVIVQSFRKISSRTIVPSPGRQRFDDIGIKHHLVIRRQSGDDTLVHGRVGACPDEPAFQKDLEDGSSMAQPPTL